MSRMSLSSHRCLPYQSKTVKLFPIVRSSNDFISKNWLALNFNMCLLLPRLNVFLARGIEDLDSAHIKLTKSSQ